MRYYLTNMTNTYKDLCSAAITGSGRTDIHIDPDPMPFMARFEPMSPAYRNARASMVGRYFSIYVDTMCDCSDFWEEFRRLEKTEYWCTFLALSK